MQKVLVIIGPTGVGKTDLSLKLAKELNGEIISGDSIQVYQGLDIGSAKATLEEREMVKHHLIDIMSAKDVYSVADFQNKGREAINEIAKANHLPIVVGGTGLYIRSLLYDYVFTKEEDEDDEFIELSNEELYAILEKEDPEALKKIHINNRRRLLRAYNVLLKTGIPFSKHIAEQKHELLYDAKIICLTMDREALYQRIDMRVDLMMKEGLIDEIKKLLASGVTFDDQAMQGIGYKEFRGYFEGDKTLDECIAEVKLNTRHFVKKQYTFFRHQFEVEWRQKNEEEAIIKECQEWLMQN